VARRGVRWRPLWQRSWWLAALVALLAAGGAFLAKSKGPGWVLLGAAGALLGFDCEHRWIRFAYVDAGDLCPSHSCNSNNVIGSLAL
jgi:uncharacterized protein (AIM24 family)